jgi:hypothetical protein
MLFYLQITEMVDNCTYLSDRFVVKQEPSDDNEPVAFPEEYIIKQEGDEEGTFPKVKLKCLKVC